MGELGKVVYQVVRRQPQVRRGQQREPQCELGTTDVDLASARLSRENIDGSVHDLVRWCRGSPTAARAGCIPAVSKRISGEGVDMARAIPRTMDAVRLHSARVDGLCYEQVETPRVQRGEALIEVHAAAAPSRPKSVSA